MASPFPAARGAAPPAPAARQALLTARALVDVLVLSAVVVALLAAWILVGLDGWRYYSTPPGVRGYDAMHRILRPSGPVGQTLGLVGLALMLVPFVYLVRKRLARRARGTANLKPWLEIHIFCGIVGPVAITFHTAFKFNGLVSVAYWSMVLVALSGFVGRYLYVRMPRTIRGAELDEAELQARLADLKEDLQWRVPPAVMAAIDREEQAVVQAAPTLRGMVTSGWRSRRSLRADLRAAGIADEAATDVLAAITEHGALVRRRHFLAQTRQLFALWHVFHLPLVWVMLVIVTLHVAVVLYLGYVPFRW